jgi:hypothetical protein
MSRDRSASTRTTAYLCSPVLSSPPGVWGPSDVGRCWHGRVDPGRVVVIEREQLGLSPEGRPGWVERGALDRGRRLALSAFVCARAPVLILVYDPCWFRGRRHDGDGVLFSLGECDAAARSLRAVHADVAAAVCRELAAVHRLTWGAGAR